MGSLDDVHLMIPSVDFSTLTDGGNADPEARQRVALDLRSKASESGFVAISGHGIPPQRLAQAFSMSRSFFQLKHEDKMRAPHPNAEVPHRGYSAIGREQGASKTALFEEDETKKEELAQTTDYKETYDIGSEGNVYQKNIWLPDEILPGFRKLESEIFWEFNKLAEIILDALIASLSLTSDEEKKIKDLHVGHDNHLRLAHYPPRPKEAISRSSVFFRLGPHTDWSTITLLFQDDCGGLEFRDRKTLQFLPAVPQEGILYMNIGDMFERLSNGIYPSAYHRVVGYEAKDTHNPSAETGRCSIVYFVVPLADGIIEPLPSLVTSERKRICEPFKYSEYSEQLHSVINKY